MKDSLLSLSRGRLISVKHSTNSSLEMRCRFLPLVVVPAHVAPEGYTHLLCFREICYCSMPTNIVLAESFRDSFFYKIEKDFIRMDLDAWENSLPFAKIANYSKRLPRTSPLKRTRLHHWH
jgi:hypothetical protein